MDQDVALKDAARRVQVPSATPFSEAYEVQENGSIQAFIKKYYEILRMLIAM